MMRRIAEDVGGIVVDPLPRRWYSIFSHEFRAISGHGLGESLTARVCAAI